MMDGVIANVTVTDEDQFGDPCDYVVVMEWGRADDVPRGGWWVQDISPKPPANRETYIVDAASDKADEEAAPPPDRDDDAGDWGWA